MILSEDKGHQHERPYSASMPKNIEFWLKHVVFCHENSPIVLLGQFFKKMSHRRSLLFDSVSWSWCTHYPQDTPVDSEAENLHFSDSFCWKCAFSHSSFVLIITITVPVIYWRTPEKFPLLLILKWCLLIWNDFNLKIDLNSNSFNSPLKYYNNSLEGRIVFITLSNI